MNTFVTLLVGCSAFVIVLVFIGVLIRLAWMDFRKKETSDDD